ncbi:RDD family protein [Paraflavitalea sp. CAU 1676]|uniref:RDD family protein n=1 Tax=Paraflavitalea sp. CAU 1676 TaxID=3032598 RepID=UPI0023DB61B5|nr:RDD family protein [Paraflavitalea sp. CAU 1676]MDF2186857.1 RDD family protein [Paraflavitalea sp. CAU 1676]
MSRPAASENLLHDIEQEMASQQDAKAELRFLNYVIDLLSFYAIVISGVFLVALTAYGGKVFQVIASMSDFSDFVLLHVFYGLYMLVVEGVFKGKTLGKLITGTRVVHQYTDSFSWRDAFRRGIMRMIPLEYFTACAGSPFHDQWTDTRVVMEKKK